MGNEQYVVKGMSIEERQSIILNMIKEEPRSFNEIMDRSKVSQTSVQTYLDELLSIYKIGYIVNDKDARWLMEMAYKKIWEDRRSGRFYFYTPKSALLFSLLNKRLEGARDQMRCKNIMCSILDFYRGLELMGLFQKKRLLTDSVLKFTHKERTGKILSDERVQEFKWNAWHDVHLYTGKHIHVELPTIHREKIGEKDFFKVSEGKFLSLERVNEYVRAFTSLMDPFMCFVAFRSEEMRNGYVTTVINKLVEFLN